MSNMFFGGAGATADLEVECPRAADEMRLRLLFAKHFSGRRVLGGVLSSPSEETIPVMSAQCGCLFGEEFW